MMYFFIYSKRCQQKQMDDDHLFLFTYVNTFFLDIVLILIFMIYFFIYSKRCQQKQVEDDHIFLFTYATRLFLEMVFIFIFSIYLFIYSKRCQQKQVEPITCFYLLMQMTSCEKCFCFYYSVSIYLFIQRDVNKSRWKRRPLFTYENDLLSDMVLVVIFSIYLFIHKSTKAGGSDDIYLLMKMTCCQTWFSL